MSAPRKLTVLTVLTASLALALAACGEEQPDSTDAEPEEAAAEEAEADDEGDSDEDAADAGDEAGTGDDTASSDDDADSEEPNVVDVISSGHSFELPEEIPAGWTTLRYHNESDATHFALLGDLPEGITADDSREEVAPVFQDAMDLINEGDPEAGFAEFTNLPEWSQELVYMGGPGFTAPGEVSQTTVELEPGNYQMECYVKTDGVWHTFDMLVDVTVTEERSNAPEPDADFEVTLTNDGMTLDGDVEAGEQTFAVNFDEQMEHGNALWHDVHVARLEDDTDLDELAAWMNWANPDGLEDPAPAEFIGGAQMMPEGHTAYVTVELERGEYAFIAEVDDPADKDLLQTVTVP